MNIQNIVRSARLYARSEAIVAEIHMRAIGRNLPSPASLFSLS
jgi:hypothetical protein